MAEDFVIADPHFDHPAIILHSGRTQWQEDNPDYDPSKPFHRSKSDPKRANSLAHDSDLGDYWNSIVGKKDRVFIVGDFAFKNHKRHIQRLNGSKILIRGNHDDMNQATYAMFKDFDPVNSSVVMNELRKECHSLSKRFANGDVERYDFVNDIIRSVWSKFVEMSQSDCLDNMSSECYRKFEAVYEMGCRRKVQKQDVTFSHYALRTWANSVYGSWNLYGYSHGRLPEFDNVLAFDVGVDVWGFVPVPWEAIKYKMSLKSRDFTDSEGKGKGQYSLDPEERRVDTLAKNLEILKKVGFSFPLGHYMSK